jgi:hypothetical protein
MKGVVLYDMNDKRIFVSRDVVHHEHILPYHSSTTPFHWTYHSTHSQPFPTHDTSHSHPNQPPTKTSVHTPNTIVHLPSNLTFHPQGESPTGFHDDSDPNQLLPPQATSPTLHDPHSHHDEEDTIIETTFSSDDLPSIPVTLTPEITTSTPEITTSPQPQPQETRKSTRIHNPPGYLSDYLCSHSNSITHESSSSGSGILYPLSDYHSYSNVSKSLSKFSKSIVETTEPKSYQEAVKHHCWIDAMDSELRALQQNGTWIYVDPPLNAKPIGSKWVYKVKHKSDGSIERYKARLVAKGYNQVEGLDFFDTFSPVAKITTVRALIGIASMKNWHLHQMDVNNAFLHGDLHEDVYMTVPQGVTSPKPHQVCKLLKSLYGLKQASRKWYEKLSGILLEQGYKQSNSDHSLFTLTNKLGFTALLIYVDDIILAGNSLTEFERIKKIMDDEFKIKDLGKLKYFLGIEVAHSTKGISICQRKYCLDLLQATGLTGSKPAPTPLDPSVKLHQDNSAAYEDIAGYRRLIGKLLYLTTTRPDIAFAIQQLSQFLSSPTIVHYETACRVVRYLKGTPGRGLFIPKAASLQLCGFADADWANCLDTRRSTSGYCFFLGSSLISWRSKKQNTVSRSSSEAEYRSLDFSTCELQWLLYLLQDLGIECTKAPVLYCDNQSAIHIAANPVFHERTKHLEIDCHLVRDKLQQGMFKLLPISTKAQLADFFTKALPPKTFNSFISKLCMLNIFHNPACGRLLNLEDTSSSLVTASTSNSVDCTVHDNYSRAHLD